MIHSFKDQTTEDIFEQANTRYARKIPREIHPIAKRKLDMIDYATDVQDLKQTPGNRLEKLVGDRLGFYSIRINDQWRIVFRWTLQGAESVEVTDYH